MDLYKFDGSHPAKWLAQMEQYFKLNHILDDWTKLTVGTRYLDNEREQWVEWYQRCNGPFQSWAQFAKSLRSRFEQEDSFLGRLTKLRQTGTVEEYITTFEALAFRIKGLTDEYYMECFIFGLKEAIKAQVRLVDSFDVTFHFLINKDGSSFAPALNLSWEAVALGVGPISSTQHLLCLSLCVCYVLEIKICSLDLALLF